MCFFKQLNKIFKKENDNPIIPFEFLINLQGCRWSMVLLDGSWSRHFLLFLHFVKLLSSCGYRASTTCRHLTRFAAMAFNSNQLLPNSSSSFNTVRLQVIVGLPLFLLPRFLFHDGYLNYISWFFP